MKTALQDLIGTSETFTRFRQDLDRVAGGDATILLGGESGSGKGGAARYLHAKGPRAGGPYVVCTLSALSPTLCEATLFGHERGAFTDAHLARLGLFRQAEGGTLVLDDVDLLPLDIQVKLLRTLQERVVEPLGAEVPVPIDVRIVATTNKNLFAEVEAQRFRQDLYYRLAVVTLDVPPLRVRGDDIVELAHFLSTRIGERLGLAPRALSTAAVERLLTHPWPGNVRELENALERVHVLGAGNGEAVEIAAEEFGFLDEATAGMPEELARSALRHGLDIEAFTLAMMRVALAEERGNVSAAARRVGLTRRAFEYRLTRAELEEHGEEPQ